MCILQKTAMAKRYGLPFLPFLLNKVKELIKTQLSEATIAF